MFVPNCQGITTASNLAIRYPFIRKGMAILEKYVASSSQMEKNTGVVAMNLEGELTAHYTDPDLSGITSGIKIGNYLYCGSFRGSYIMRLDLEQHPAVTTTWASSTRNFSHINVLFLVYFIVCFLFCWKNFNQNIWKMWIAKYVVVKEGNPKVFVRQHWRELGELGLLFLSFA